MRNLLIGQGVRIVTPRDSVEGAPIHVSGHPARDDLLAMYQWLQPRIAIPVHGETRHLLAHAELAGSCQVQQVLVPEDGALIRLAPDRAGIDGLVAAGQLALGRRSIDPAAGTARRSAIATAWPTMARQWRRCL